MEDTCPYIDRMLRQPSNILVCYINGRMLGGKWLSDYCVYNSKYGHKACPIFIEYEKNNKKT